MAGTTHGRVEEVAMRVLESRARMPYADLAARATRGGIEAFEDGVGREALQVEVQYFFDAGRSGPVRITVAVDDGGLGAVLPFTRDTLVERGSEA